MSERAGEDEWVVGRDRRVVLMFVGHTCHTDRSDRSGLCATQDQKSGVSGHLLGVSGLPSPEFPGLNPECLDHHKPGVSEPMAGLSGPLPVRPVLPRPKPRIPWRGENRPLIPISF